MNFRRVCAVVIRQAFLYRRSFTRILEVFYWPAIDILLWGFVTVYLLRSSKELPAFVSFFLGALILWDILFRAQQGISLSFLEDIWARNLVNVFISPLTVSEYLLGLILVSVLKVFIAFFMMSFIAGILYSFNIFKLGLSLLPLTLNLIAMGWSIGIITVSLILRFGQEAEVLAWALAFLFMPFSAVFYPVDTLPGFLKFISMIIPSSYSFEAMRSVINGSPFPFKLMLTAAVLNGIYILISIKIFYKSWKNALERGIIPKIGE